MQKYFCSFALRRIWSCLWAANQHQNILQNKVVLLCHCISKIRSLLWVYHIHYLTERHIGRNICSCRCTDWLIIDCYGFPRVPLSIFHMLGVWNSTWVGGNCTVDLLFLHTTLLNICLSWSIQRLCVWPYGRTLCRKLDAHPWSHTVSVVLVWNDSVYLEPSWSWNFRTQCRKGCHTLKLDIPNPTSSS